PSTSGRLSIYNMALGFIGTRTIASANENTPEAIQCELFWNNARRAALRDYPYPFAQARVNLALLAKFPEEYENEWQYAYSWPNKALKVHRIHSQGKENRLHKEKYIVRIIDNITTILCNTKTPLAEITQDIIEVSLWDDMFVHSMARKLACLIAVPLLKNNSQKIQECEQLYAMQLQNIRSQAASEEEEAQSEIPDSWLLARGGWHA
ncbi:MAG: hypothetical protein LUJ25_08515, partial [Firmicutes bacterium]|nr:hypothetical protein [Bacillota bacterium]